MQAGVWIVGVLALISIACAADSDDQVPIDPVPTDSPTPVAAQSPEPDTAPTIIPGSVTAEPPLAASVPEPTPTSNPVSATVTPAPATPLPEPTHVICTTPPAFTTPINQRSVISGQLGEVITLDGESLFDVTVSGDEYEWAQLFAAQDSLHNTSHNLVTVDQQENAVATFIPVFRATIDLAC